MTCTTLTPAVSLHRAWVPTMLNALMARLRYWHHAWQTHERRLREQREIALVSELDPRMLRDIGAPDDLQATVMARHQACGDWRNRLLGEGAWRHW